MSGYQSEEWFRRAFEDVYLSLYDHRTDEAARQEISSISDWVPISNESVVLDLGCGNGRHVAAWSEQGISVLGIDLSPDLIQRARNRSLSNALFLEGDMRALQFTEMFSLVTSLFTSFGYFAQESDDQRVLQGVADSLETKGHFVLDFLNSKLVRNNLVAESEDQKGDFWVRQSRRISPDGRRVEKTIKMSKDDGWQREHQESVRLYDEADLLTMLENVGLRVEQRFGNFGGETINEQSERIILVAQKVNNTPR